MTVCGGRWRLQRRAWPMGSLRMVFVRLRRLVPSASLTSSVANSHDSDGKLMLKLMRSRSPCALRSTTISVLVCTRRKLDSSCSRTSNAFVLCLALRNAQNYVKPPGGALRAALRHPPRAHLRPQEARQLLQPGPPAKLASASTTTQRRDSARLTVARQSIAGLLSAAASVALFSALHEARGGGQLSRQETCSGSPLSQGKHI